MTRIYHYLSTVCYIQSGSCPTDLEFFTNKSQADELHLGYNKPSESTPKNSRVVREVIVLLSDNRSFEEST